MARARGTHPDSSTGADGKLPMVGRERARSLLDRWLDESVSGSPRIVTVAGAAGIGKTRLTEWLTTLASARGVAVHCGSALAGASVAYLPFRIAFAELLDASGGPVSRLLDGSDTAPPDHPVVASGAVSGHGLIGVAEAVVEAARQTPRLIVLDDVQWADQPSLDLISQLATLLGHRAATAPVPVMLVIGSRTGEAGEPHERLADSLHREPNARSLELVGLDHLELLALITEIGGAPPTPALTRQVADATDGNPLLTLWLLRRLLATEVVTVTGGLLRAPSRGPLRIDATDIDTELSRRLDAVSAPAQHLITVAAGLGDGGTLEELALAAAVSTADLDAGMVELEDSGLLTDDGHRYRFVQGQLRQVALGRLSRRQRQALHLTIADRLADAYADAVEEHALVLAEHLCQGAAPAARLVDICATAGARAQSRDLLGPAARYYEAAIEAAEELSVPPPERAAWCLGAGIAHFNMLDLPHAEQRLCEAISSADSEDLMTRGRAALVLVRCRLTQGAIRPGQLVDLRELEAFLATAEAADREPGLRALALGLMAESHFSAYDLAAGFDMSRQARRLSQEVGDDAVACMVEVAEGIQHLAGLRLDDATGCFERSVEHGRRRDPGLPLAALARQALVEWLRGDLEAADALIRQSIEATEPRFQWGEQSFAIACSVGLAALRGQHRHVEELGEQARRLSRASLYPYAASQLYPAIAWSRAVRGDRAGAHEAIDEWRGGVGRGGATFRPVLDALAGTLDSGAVVPAGWRVAPPDDLTLLDVSALVARVELGDATDDVDLVVPTLEPLEQLLELGVSFSLDRGSFLPRLAGVAAFRSGQLERADEHLRRAELALVSGVDSPGELARCRLDRARLLIAREARGDRREAGRLLDAAAEGFDALGMFPFLERVLVAKDALPGAVVHALTPSSSTRILLVTDLVDSTPLNVRLGDVAYVEVLAAHDHLVRARLRQHGGVEFKHTGDGFCAWFPVAEDAVAAASGVQRDLDEWRELHPETDLHVRCGLAAGRPIEVEGDLFGSSVALASRVCALAATDETLLTIDVVGLLEDGSAGRCSPRGEFELKGFPGAVAVYSAPSAP